MTDSLPHFKKFLSTCSSLLRQEGPQFLSLIRSRYDRCHDDIRNSQHMVALLNSTMSKMLADDKRLFVHLKDFITQLKAWCSDGKGHSSSRKRKADAPRDSLAKLARIIDDSTSDGSDLEGKLQRALDQSSSPTVSAASEPACPQSASCSQSPMTGDLELAGSDVEPTTTSRSLAPSPNNASLSSAAGSHERSHSSAVEKDSASSVLETDSCMNDGNTDHRIHGHIPPYAPNLSRAHCSGPAENMSSQEALAASQSPKVRTESGDDTGSSRRREEETCHDRSHTNGSSDGCHRDQKIKSHTECLTGKQESGDLSSRTDDVKCLTPMQVSDTSPASKTEVGKFHMVPVPISPHRSQDTKPTNKLFPQGSLGSLSSAMKIGSLGDAIHRLKHRLASQQQSAAAAILVSHSQSTVVSHSQSTAVSPSQSSTVGYPQSRNINGEVSDDDTKHSLIHDGDYHLTHTVVDNRHSMIDERHKVINDRHRLVVDRQTVDDDRHTVDDDSKHRMVDPQTPEKWRKPATVVRHSPEVLKPSTSSGAGGRKDEQQFHFDARQPLEEDIEEPIRESRQVRRLENLLEKIRDEIERVRAKDLSLDDLDAEDSAYIYEDRLQKKFMKVWERLCKVKGQAATTGRPIERKFKYSGSRFPEINRKIEKFVNRPNVFPDYHDIRGIIKKVNTRCHLGLNVMQINSISKETFMDVGEALQRRRKADYISTFHSKQTLPHCSEQDPALFDDSLRRKLEENYHIGRNRLEGVIKKYTDLQLMLGDGADKVDTGGPSTSYDGLKSSQPELHSKSNSLHQPKSPSCFRSKSPLDDRSKSPSNHQSRSPSHYYPHSPLNHHQLVSPTHCWSNSSMHQQSVSPSRHHCHSPPLHQSRSPSHHKPRSPGDDRSRSPTHHRSKSPSYNHQSQSPSSHQAKSLQNHWSRSPVDQLGLDQRSNTEHDSDVASDHVVVNEDGEARTSPQTLRNVRVVLMDCVREVEAEEGREEDRRTKDFPDEEMEENENDDDDDDDGLNMIEMDIAEECHLLMDGGDDSEDNADWPQQITDTTTTSDWPELSIVRNEADGWSQEPGDNNNSSWRSGHNQSGAWSEERAGTSTHGESSKVQLNDVVLISSTQTNSQTGGQTEQLEKQVSRQSQSFMGQGEDSVELLEDPRGSCQVIDGCELGVQGRQVSRQWPGDGSVSEQATHNEPVWIENEDSSQQPLAASLAVSAPCSRNTATDSGVTCMNQLSADTCDISTPTSDGGEMGRVEDVCLFQEGGGSGVVEVYDVSDSSVVSNPMNLGDSVQGEDAHCGLSVVVEEDSMTEHADPSVLIEVENTGHTDRPVVIEVENAGHTGPYVVIADDENTNHTGRSEVLENENPKHTAISAVIDGGAYPTGTPVVPEDGDLYGGRTSEICSPASRHGGCTSVDGGASDKSQGSWLQIDVEINGSSAQKQDKKGVAVSCVSDVSVAERKERNSAAQGGCVECVPGNCASKDSGFSSAADQRSPTSRSVHNSRSNTPRTENTASPAPSCTHSPESVSTMKTSKLHIGPKSRTPVTINPDLRLPKCLQRNSDGLASKADSFFYPDKIASGAYIENNGDSITIGSSDEEGDSGQADVKKTLSAKLRPASKAGCDEEVIVLSDDD